MGKSKPFEISKAIIWEAWEQVRKNRGSHGVDLQSLEMFEGKLKDNLYKVWNRMSSGCYFPPAVRAVDIPKKSGKMRRLGIPTIGDRVAQAAIVKLLEPKLEPIFLDDSYGYRPGRSAHDAVRVTRERCFRYAWVLEFDIVGMFDNIPHELILKALNHHSEDRVIILYVERWLKAPMLSPEGEQVPRASGVPQGGVISPLLMNLFMHYAFDLWVTRETSNPWCRYADDGLIHCSTKAEGQSILAMLRRRMSECGLELHPEKTRLVYCADGFRKQQNKGAVKKFTFLGFDFEARNAKSRRTGRVFRSFQPGVSQQAIRAMKYRIKHVWRLPYRTDLSLEDLAEMLNDTLRGWLNYYSKFYKTALYRICRYLNQCLAFWARRKFKRLYRRYSSSYEYIHAMYSANPKLFVHWQFLKVY